MRLIRGAGRSHLTVGIPLTCQSEKSIRLFLNWCTKIDIIHIKRFKLKDSADNLLVEQTE